MMSEREKLESVCGKKKRFHFSHSLRSREKKIHAYRRLYHFALYIFDFRGENTTIINHNAIIEPHARPKNINIIVVYISFCSLKYLAKYVVDISIVFGFCFYFGLIIYTWLQTRKKTNKSGALNKNFNVSLNTADYRIIIITSFHYSHHFNKANTLNSPINLTLVCSFFSMYILVSYK